jgi:beta-lactamase class A
MTRPGTELRPELRETREMRTGLRPVAPGKRRPGPARSRLKIPFQPGRHAQAESSGRRQPSLLVHLCRLLIVGVGVGAIAGTIFSVANPSLRQPSVANQIIDPVGQPGGTINRAAVPGTLATISSVRMGREMTDLVAKVTPLTRDLTDLVPGVFLMDFDNGNYLSFNGSTAFSSASMIKLPILIAFFQDVDAGRIKLDEMLSLQQADLAEGSGNMQDSNVGTQFTALDTATNMIITSDNTATNMIIRRLGGSEVLNQRFRQWGLQQTLLRKPLPDLEGLNTTSPKELVSLLALLNDGKLLSMKSRDRTFDIMRRTVTDTLLPSIMSPGSTVAHKTGDIGSLVGDVGVVDLPSGRRYGIAVVVKRPHNDGRAQDLIRQIAAVVYEHFGGQPMMAPSPVASPPAQVAPPTAAPAGMPPISPGAAAGPAPGVPLAPGAPTAPLTAPLAPAAPIAPVAPGPEAVAPPPEATAPEPVDPQAEQPMDQQMDQQAQPQDAATDQEPPL